jgi:hypothetical protein
VTAETATKAMKATATDEQERRAAGGNRCGMPRM